MRTRRRCGLRTGFQTSRFELGRCASYQSQLVTSCFTCAGIIANASWKQLGTTPDTVARTVIPPKSWVNFGWDSRLLPEVLAISVVDESGKEGPVQQLSLQEMGDQFAQLSCDGLWCVALRCSVKHVSRGQNLVIPAGGGCWLFVFTSAATVHTWSFSWHRRNC
jgi:hypothetical protein